MNSNEPRCPLLGCTGNLVPTDHYGDPAVRCRGCWRVFDPEILLDLTYTVRYVVGMELN